MMMRGLIDGKILHPNFADEKDSCIFVLGRYKCSSQNEL